MFFYTSNKISKIKICRDSICLSQTFVVFSRNKLWFQCFWGICKMYEHALSENGFLGIQNKVSNAYESAVLASMKKAFDEKQNGVAGE